MFAIMREDLGQESETTALSTLMSDCKKLMKLDGVDLAGYNTRENAADFEDLRKALGYKKWNLFGGSYGTRLGLTIMRDFPNSVRSSVLVGVFAPESNLFENFLLNFEKSLFSVLERCKNNENCNNRYPNLTQRLLNVLKKIQTAPLRFDYEGKPFVLNSQDAMLIIHLSLFNRYYISTIPLLIEAMENGETEPLVNALKFAEFLSNLVNWPMNHSVTAYEEIPFYDAAAMEKATMKSRIIEFLPVTFDLNYKSLANWHSLRADSFENQPVVSEIPSLLVSGSLDPVTPPSYAQEALKHLKNGYGIIFPDESHDFVNPCFLQITEDFLNDPSHKPNTACSEVRNPIEWNLSNSIQ